MRFFYIFTLVLILLPLQSQAQLGAIDTFFSNATGLLGNVLVPAIVAVSLVVFLWGMFTYFIAGGGDEGQREKGKGFIVYGILGLLLITIVWGVVNFLANGLVAGMGQGAPDAKLKVFPDTPGAPSQTPGPGTPENYFPNPAQENV
jgi:hypothetical protein